VRQASYVSFVAPLESQAHGTSLFTSAELSKLLKRHSKAKRRALAYSRALSLFTSAGFAGGYTPIIMFKRIRN